jgi:hypothetical protein
MNEFLKAADDAKRLLRGFAAIGEVATAFEDAGRAVQAKDEAAAALADLSVAIEKERFVLAEVKADVEMARRKLKSDAESIVSKAEEKAARIVADAEGRASDVMAAAQVALDSANARAEVAKNEAASAMLALDDATANLAEIEKKADKARAYLAKLAS